MKIDLLRKGNDLINTSNFQDQFKPMVGVARIYVAMYPWLINEIQR